MMAGDVISPIGTGSSLSIGNERFWRRGNEIP